MATIHITKGHNIKISGNPEKKINTLACPDSIKIIPDNYDSIKPKLLIKEGDQVKVGDKIFLDKNNPSILFCSHVSGVIKSIKLGDRRKIEEIEVTCENNDASISKPEIDTNKCSDDDIKKILLESGLWPSIRQRPFSKIADPLTSPKSIFVTAMPTAPFSLDLNFVLKGENDSIKKGFDILNKLTSGDINLIVDRNKEYDIFPEIDSVNKHYFSGPHPSGNTGIHIHHIDPIADKNDIVWYISLQDLNDIGKFFNEGIYPSEKYISCGGSCLSSPSYYKIKKGMIISDILKNQKINPDHVLISGDILSGEQTNMEQPLNFYSEVLSAIPNNKNRDFLGWILPGLNKYSLSRTFLSSFFSKKQTNFDTRINGSRRAIIPFGRWERMLPMDIIPNFLIKSIIAKDIEDMEKYGIYECDHEDFSLCAYACQSKVEVSKIIKEGLELMEKEG
jgi:Na+-transporting NADH:ubiquinone oxidoreductase subunit A